MGRAQEDHPSRRSERRWYQFTIRGLLLLTLLLVSIVLSWFCVRLRQAQSQREAVQAIQEAGGSVNYDYEVFRAPPTPPGPAWLRNLLGDDFFVMLVAA